MRKASPELIALLNSEQQFRMADLFTITLNGGFVARYTSADTDLTYNGNTYKKFLITRSRTRLSVGLEVDTLNITAHPGPADLLNGASWLAAVRNGALDGADVKLERVFMPTWGDTSLGTIVLFQGRVAEIEVSRTEVKITVKSELELLDIQLPRNFYQSGCINTLFDNGCGLQKALWGADGIVTGASLTQVSTNLTRMESDYFALGSISFTTGPNAGITRSVREFAGGVFVLAVPLVSPPRAGDTFTAWPGCNRLHDTCRNKFMNVLNFRGFPFVPDPEAAV